MGDIIDDFLAIGKELSGVKDDLTGMAGEITGTKKDPVALWDPSRYTVKPKIIYDLCLHTKSDKATCTLCADACPVDAITIDEGALIFKSEACTGCGLCIAACPTAALSAQRIDPKAVYDKLAANASADEATYVTCPRALKRTPDAGIEVLPCVGVMNAELWASLLVAYPNVAVFLPLDVCEKCPHPKGEEFLGSAIETAETWSGKNVGLECSMKDLHVDKKHEVERKEFVNSILKKTVTGVSKTNPLTAGAMKVYEKLDKHKSTLDGIQKTLDRVCGVTEGEEETVTRTLTPSRKLLLAAMKDDEAFAKRVMLQQAVTTGSCDGCGECVSVCPMGARKLEEGKADTIAAYCVGCGLCTQVCPKQAVTLVETPGTACLEELADEPDEPAAGDEAKRADEEA